MNAAVAAEPSNRDVIEQVVACRAPLSSAVAFSHAINGPDFDLIGADEYAPWGGLAWRVYPAIKLGNVSSEIVIMDTHSNFYLRVPSKNPDSDIRTVAKALQLKVKTDRDHYLVYQKALSDRTIEVKSTENADDFWVGCFYDQEAFLRMEDTLHNDTPAVIRKNNVLQNILEAE